MFPDDTTLLARGRYATLSRERKQQLDRFQKVCSMVMSKVAAALKDAADIPPVNSEPLQAIERCLANLSDARAKLVDLSTQMAELRPTAWPE
jgi:hypothetical protein